MKTNWIEVDHYYADLVQWNEDKTCKVSWGINICKEGRDVFTVKLANELIDIANKKYKEIFGRDVNFNWIKLDMTEYTEDMENLLDDGVSHPRSYVKKKIGKYNKEKNILRIFIDDVPVYENNNGKICKDSCALADCLRH